MLVALYVTPWSGSGQALSNLARLYQHAPIWLAPSLASHWPCFKTVYRLLPRQRHARWLRNRLANPSRHYSASLTIWRCAAFSIRCSAMAISTPICIPAIFLFAPMARWCQLILALWAISIFKTGCFWRGYSAQCLTAIMIWLPNYIKTLECLARGFQFINFRNRFARLLIRWWANRLVKSRLALFWDRFSSWQPALKSRCSRNIIFCRKPWWWPKELPGN